MNTFLNKGLRFFQKFTCQEHNCSSAIPNLQGEQIKLFLALNKNTILTLLLNRHFKPLYQYSYNENQRSVLECMIDSQKKKIIDQITSKPSIIQQHKTEHSKIPYLWSSHLLKTLHLWFNRYEHRPILIKDV